ncbi:hypothetical protein BLNAU_9098 [Blattamonas nauphoetae]|uniref:Uncharacterized protein n=1 Tax=Blattamonas nauphoetae TaxID=2049346 RepID=A0ABQ9XWT2_9EUKA|nr:hypothetical protein BLNAU_9098 [Blattamonas nauphoetae]
MGRLSGKSEHSESDGRRGGETDEREWDDVGSMRSDCNRWDESEDPSLDIFYLLRWKASDDQTDRMCSERVDSHGEQREGSVDGADDETGGGEWERRGR